MCEDFECMHWHTVCINWHYFRMSLRHTNRCVPLWHTPHRWVVYGIPISVVISGRLYRRIFNGFFFLCGEMRSGRRVSCGGRSGCCAGVVCGSSVDLDGKGVGCTRTKRCHCREGFARAECFFRTRCTVHTQTKHSKHKQCDDCLYNARNIHYAICYLLRNKTLFVYGVWYFNRQTQDVQLTWRQQPVRRFLYDFKESHASFVHNIDIPHRCWSGLEERRSCCVCYCNVFRSIHIANFITNRLWETEVSC